MERKFLVVLLVVAMFFVSGPQALLPAQQTLFVDSDGDGIDDSEDPCPDSEGIWETTVVDSTIGAGKHSTSIAVDSDDNPRIAYHESVGQDLEYAWFNGTSWNNTELETSGNVGYGISMKLNSEDDSLISYADRTNYPESGIEEDFVDLGHPRFISEIGPGEKTTGAQHAVNLGDKCTHITVAMAGFDIVDDIE